MDITHELESLQKNIAAISKAHLDEASLSFLTSDLELGIKNLNSLNWIHYLVMIGALILLFLLVVLLFPCLFKLLLHSIRTVE